MKANIYFLIPIFNEAENLPFLLESITRVGRYYDLLPHIIAVDDGSSDNSVSTLSQYDNSVDIHIIQHGRNLGPGAAFRNGFAYLNEVINNQDIVVTIEADNTSDLCVLGKMIALLERGDDVVLANVYGAGKIVGATFLRRFTSYWANIIMKLSLRIRGVETFTSFFRVYQGRAIKNYLASYGDQAITESGFTCMLEMLIKFNLLGLNIGQVPMILDSKIRIGDSKMKIVRNIKATLHVLYNHLILGKYRLRKKGETGEVAYPKNKI